MKNEYGTGGKGFEIGGAKYAVWFDDLGLRIATGSTAKGGTVVNAFLSWEDVSNRIHELLRQGEYAPQAVLDAARQNALQEHAQTLAYMERDLADEDFQEAMQKYLSEKWNMPKKEDVVSEIIEKAAPVPDNSAQDYSDVPVYYEPFGYAKENDEVDLYRTSYRLNSECKQAIHEAIADNYDGMYLGDGAVDQVVRQYGMERVGYILANTLHHT